MQCERTKPLYCNWNADWDAEPKDISWADLHKISEALVMGQGEEEEMGSHILTRDFQHTPILSLESVNQNLKWSICPRTQISIDNQLFSGWRFKSFDKEGKASLDGLLAEICKLISQTLSLSYIIPQLRMLFSSSSSPVEMQHILKKNQHKSTPGFPVTLKENYFFLSLSLNNILILSPVNIYYTWVYIINVDTYKNIWTLYMESIGFFVFLPVFTNFKSPEQIDSLQSSLLLSYIQEEKRGRHHIIS